MRIPFGSICRMTVTACRRALRGGFRQKPFVLSDQLGFTLLEILVAIFIFAIVMTTIYASFNAVISRNEAIEQGRGIYEMARNCLNRMASDLMALYIDLPPQYEPPDFDDPENPYRFTGSEEGVGSETFSRLRFAADAHLPMAGDQATGLAEIEYYVERRYEPEEEYVLHRSDTSFPYEIESFPADELPDPVICKGVRAFNLTFFDAAGETREEWDSEANMGNYATPRAVGIKLEVSDGKTSHAFHTTVTLPVYREELDSERRGP